MCNSISTCKRICMISSLFAIFLATNTILPAVFMSDIPLDPHFCSFTTVDGLSQNSVRSLLIDNKGFLWIGTEDGINRYDGYDFMILRHDPRNKNSLSSSYVWSLLEDHYGKIWIGTFGGGLCRYDPTTEKICRFTGGTSDTSLTSKEIKVLFEDSKKRLWVGASDGSLFRYLQNENTFQRYSLSAVNENADRNRYLFFINEDSSGAVWVGKGAQLFSLSPGEKEFRQVKLDCSVYGLSVFYTMIVDHSGILWFGTNKGLIRYDPVTSNIKCFQHNPRLPASLSQNTVYSILNDSEGHLWVGTQNGLNLFQEKTSSFQHFFADPFDPNSISNNIIYSLAEDPFGNVWIGTSEGLNYFEKVREQFYHYQHHPGDRSSLGNDQVHAFAENRDGRIWVGTNEGLILFDPVKKTFISSANLSAGKETSILRRRVRSLLMDNRGKLWIGTFNGLYRYTTAQVSGSLHNTEYPGPLELFGSASDFISCIYQDPDDKIWVGTNNGLKRIDPVSGKTLLYPQVQNNPNSIHGTAIMSIIRDRQKNLWLGTGRGIIRMNSPEGTFHSFNLFAGISDSTLSIIVYCLLEDSKGRLWVGTNGLGLFRFLPDENRFLRYGREDGLKSEVIYALLEDNQGILWLSTNLGLWEFDPDAIQFTQYTTKDGLQGMEFNRQAALKSRDGSLYFGGINGFNTFSPEQIKPNTYKPRIILTKLWINNRMVSPGDTLDGKIILRKSITQTDTIRLSPIHKMLRIGFAALHYSSPKENQIRYRLDGFDSNWIEAGNNHGATYTNLDPATYTFEVKGSNSDGIWNEKSTRLCIIVTPPFYRKLLFRIILLLFVSALFLTAHKLRLAFIKKRNRELAAVNERLELEIGKRKESEKALQDSEEKYRSLTNNINVGIFRTTADQRGRFLEVNPAMVELLGYQNKDELLGISVLDSYSDPRDRERFQAKMKTNRWVKDEELLLLKKDGTPIWCSISAAAFEKDGKIFHYDGVLIDITDQVQTRKKLAAERHLLRWFVEFVPTPIYLKDRQGHFILANNALAEHMNCQSAELIGKTDFDFYPKEEAKLRLQDEQKVMDENTIISKEETGKTPTGIRWYYTTKAPRYDENMNIVGTYGISWDITERKKGEEQIKKDLTEKNLLLKEIHHRVKNNLQVISSLLNLQAAYIQNDKDRDMFRSSQARVKSISLVHERIYHSDNLASVDLGQYVTGLCRSLFRSIDISKDDVNLEIHTGDISISLDRAVPCGLILNELISNALKHAFPKRNPEKDKISISLTKENGDILLIVKDNGRRLPDGIDVKKTDSLGLRLVTLLTEQQLDGNLTIKRENGTAFLIRFPLSTKEE